jgi:hypothetical protein
MASERVVDSVSFENLSARGVDSECDATIAEALDAIRKFLRSDAKKTDLIVDGYFGRFIRNISNNIPTRLAHS